MRMEVRPKFCKLCRRQFANGKALGGHMRSHLAPLPLPPKTPPQDQDSGEGDEKQSPLKRSGSADPAFFDAGSEKPSGRRSKRSRRLFLAEKNKGTEGQGGRNKEKMAEKAKLSFCDDENVAWCLLMLANDAWEGSEPWKQSKTSKRKENFQCEICSRVFKCSQALGSHRTAHRNKNTMVNNNADEFDAENLVVKGEDQKTHECPFCGKIFGSGQALGGHKKSHYAFSSPSPSASSSCSSKLLGSLVESNHTNVPKLMIDLNFPAEMEETG